MQLTRSWRKSRGVLLKMLIYRSFDMGDTPMGEIIDILNLVNRLVSTAYPELNQCRIRIKWGRSSSFATISWTHDFKEVNIRCSNETRKWHESALTGLLAHELSHPVQQTKYQSEYSADIDAIERGFGPYLGIERLVVGKYDDHVILKGKDRYLGYRSIRQLLNEDELEHLDALLTQLRLIPSRKELQKEVHHDIIIIHSETNTIIQIEGHKFKIDILKDDVEVRTIAKDNTIHVIIDGEEVGYFNSPIN